MSSLIRAMPLLGCLLIAISACGYRQAEVPAVSTPQPAPLVTSEETPPPTVMPTDQPSSQPEQPAASSDEPAEEESLTEHNGSEKKRNLPEGFVYADEAIPKALFEFRYNSDYNFVGERVAGYRAPVLILSIQAAEALRKASEELDEQGYAFLIYDGYRPQKAVSHFIAWAKDAEDTKMKSEFYPDIDKTKVFKLGYVATRSGHSRGSTVDLTIVHKETGVPVDMGSPFDFFGEISSHGTKRISAEQTDNRNILKNVMVKYGFKPYNKEWWHYTLKNEPYPDEYFDFDVE